MISQSGRAPAKARIWSEQGVTYDNMLHCEHEFAPEIELLTKDSVTPLVADANGKYSVPQPGILVDRDF